MQRTILSLIAAAGLAALASTPVLSAPQTSAITYQGVLEDNGAPVDGQVDLRVSLFDAASGGSALATVTLDDHPIADGVFSAELDFGVGPFELNEQRWVQVEARPFDSTGPFTALPRQSLTAAPYALNTRGISVDGSGDGAVTIRGGADIVEGFDSICDTAFEPGTVLVIDPENPGMLMCASGAYDRKVAGVVSGAGGVQPGIKLGQSGVLDGDIPVAMTGRVYVKATAANGAVEPGDLLTTAELSGHAMRATDADRSHGAVIGKAMTGLDAGEGLVLVLVNLQ
ncbi:MAG: hypothetical protein RIB60_08165 [Phycisphaerales bacterium]